MPSPHAAGSFKHVHLEILSDNERLASARHRGVSWTDATTSIKIGTGGAAHSQLDQGEELV